MWVAIREAFYQCFDSGGRAGAQHTPSKCVVTLVIAQIGICVVSREAQR